MAVKLDRAESDLRCAVSGERAAELLHLHGVTKDFGGGAGITEIDLCVPPAKVVGIVGPSGCGKSTLLDIIAGVTQPTAGTICVQTDAKYGTGFGYMQQKDLLLAWRDAKSNAMLGLELRGMGKREALAEVKRYTALLGIDDALDKRVSQLSGGMRQRFSLLRSLVIARGLLLLDEPFSALDALTRRTIQTWMAEVIKQRGLSAILVTHDVEEALLMSDEVLVLGGSPSSVVGKFELPSARPRRPSVLETAEFIKLKQAIYALLTGADDEV